MNRQAPKYDFATPSRPALRHFDSHMSGSSQASLSSSEDVFDTDMASPNSPFSPISPGQMRPDQFKAVSTSDFASGPIPFAKLDDLQRGSTTNYFDRRSIFNRERNGDVQDSPLAQSPGPSQINGRRRTSAFSTNSSRLSVFSENASRGRSSSAPNLSTTSRISTLPASLRKSLSSFEEGNPISSRKTRHRPPQDLYPYGRSKTRDQITQDIKDCITGKAKRHLNLSSPEVGCVYVFESPKHASGHLKIGSTKICADNRKEQIEKCVQSLVKVNGWGHQDDFAHYRIVESILKKAFHAERRSLPCNVCKTTHCEWFKVDKHMALSAVELWRKWVMVQKPYNKEGRLTAYWQWRADQIQTYRSSIDWEAWTQPPRIDYCKYQWEIFEANYLPALVKHLKRKDGRFVLVGTIILLIVANSFGKVGGLYMFIALLVL